MLPYEDIYLALSIIVIQNMPNSPEIKRPNNCNFFESFSLLDMVSVCVCVCVREREIERVKERKKNNEIDFLSLCARKYSKNNFNSIISNCYIE